MAVLLPAERIHYLPEAPSPNMMIGETVAHPSVSTTLTSSGYWVSAAGAAVLAILLTVLAVRVLPRDRFRLLGFEIVLAAAVSWGILATALVLTMWDSYYTFFAQDWQRPLAPFSAILYAGIALLLWWLARRLPGRPALIFVILGGLGSLVERSIVIWGVGLFEKVPMLAGVDPAPVLVCAFFEYVIYWGLTLALARLLAGPLAALRSRLDRRTPS